MLDVQIKEMKAFFIKKMVECLKPISDEIAELKKELHQKIAVIEQKLPQSKHLTKNLSPLIST